MLEDKFLQISALGHDKGVNTRQICLAGICKHKQILSHLSDSVT